MPDSPGCTVHSPAILGDDHDTNKKRSWWVIALCAAMMVVEIVGGLLYGSIALVADGLHMSTHAGALLLAALAYTFASRHATDTRFTFGTGKMGDLAGFTSAVVLAMIALLIGYEAIGRLFAPVAIDFVQAIPIAVLGLTVNVASVFVLSGGHHHHHHGHSHGHDHHGHAHDEAEKHVFAVDGGRVALTIHEDGVPPRFRVQAEGFVPDVLTIRTVRPDGASQVFGTVRQDDGFESIDEVPEPHEFQAVLLVERAGRAAEELAAVFEEHAHGDHAMHRDNNMRAAVVHVMADAAVSLLVIVGLVLARIFGWLWLDPLAGVIGAVVIATWAYALVRDTGKVLLDMVPDRAIARRVRETVEREGDELADFHLWRLGPGHLGAILSVRTTRDHGSDFYRAKLARFGSLSHVTVETIRAT